MMMDEWQPILRVKGAAGTISLMARQRDTDQWEYCRINSITSTNQEPIIVDTFTEALSLLGPSWRYLTPEYIHPQFKQQCWSQLSKQTGMFDRVNWRRACL